MTTYSQLLSLIFGIVATVAVTITTFLNRWAVSSSISNGLAGPTTAWKGLFSECLQFKNESTLCKGQTSIFLTSDHILAIRALMISSIVLTALGCIGTLIGSNCTKPLEDRQKTKNKVIICSGIGFGLAGAFTLTSGLWYGILAIKFLSAENENNIIRWNVGACFYLVFASCLMCTLASSECLCSVICKKNKNSSCPHCATQGINVSRNDQPVSPSFYQNKAKAHKFFVKYSNRSPSDNVNNNESRYWTSHDILAQARKDSTNIFKNASDSYRDYEYV